MRDAVILETFKGSHGDESLRVYWLADLKRPTFDSRLAQNFCVLYDKAVEMERKEQTKAA
jgi:hypothetical protein